MKIQDLDRKSAARLMEISGDAAIVLEYEQIVGHEIHPENKVVFEPDPRFILPDCAPYVRRLEMTRENDEVLVGIFSIPENAGLPYPLCAQYSMYAVDKKEPTRNCGGGIIPCEKPYPSIKDRLLGMDREDYIKVQKFINEVLLKSGFQSQFPIDPGEEYHRYWADLDNEPMSGEPGEAKRGKDGTLRILEFTREQNGLYFEVISSPDRYTEYTGDDPCYSIDVFKLDGGIVSGFRFNSAVMWPPLRERKFGMDYIDYVAFQGHINKILEANKWGEPLPVDDDKERPCYYAQNRELTALIVMKRKMAESNTKYIRSEQT